MPIQIYIKYITHQNVDIYDILSLFVHGHGLAPDKDDEVGERYCSALLAHILARLGFEI